MTNPKNAAKIFTVISILFFAISTRAQTSDSIYKIPKGTRIRLRMDNEINSRVSTVGDTFTAVAVAPVIINGVERLPAGTVIEGKITGVKKAAFGKSHGSFKVKFDTLYFSKDTRLLLDASLISSEKPKSSSATGALTIAGATGAGALIGTLLDKTRGALVGAGIGLGISTGAILLQKGEEARITAGEEFEILINQDVILPAPDF
jgi:hypothetical protein